MTRVAVWLSLLSLVAICWFLIAWSLFGRGWFQ